MLPLQEFLTRPKRNTQKKYIYYHVSVYNAAEVMYSRTMDKTHTKATVLQRTQTIILVK